MTVPGSSIAHTLRLILAAARRGVLRRGRSPLGRRPKPEDVRPRLRLLQPGLQQRLAADEEVVADALAAGDRKEPDALRPLLPPLEDYP